MGRKSAVQIILDLIGYLLLIFSGLWFLYALYYSWQEWQKWHYGFQLWRVYAIGVSLLPALIGAGFRKRWKWMNLTLIAAVIVSLVVYCKFSYKSDFGIPAELVGLICLPFIIILNIPVFKKEFKS